MDKSHLSQKQLAAAMGIAALSGLYVSSLYSYLLYHTLVELFSIVVSFAIFILAWNTRRVQENHYLLYLGIALLFTSALEMLHTLAYKGFGVFPAHDANLATQLWIAFRYLLSFSFLGAALFITRRLDLVKMTAGYALVTSLLIGSIFLGMFPDCFIEGRGLTPFKIVSEYIIIFLFLAALGLLIRNRPAFDPGVWRLMAGAVLTSVLSELSFTQYVSVFGPANMIGHFFMLASVICIYQGIVVTGIAEPTRLLFRNLKLSEEALQLSRADLEIKVRERTSELARANEDMEAEIAERMRAEAEVRTLNRELERRVSDRTAQLEAANRELEAFSYSVSHDLRAPLRSIAGFAKAVEEEYSAGLDSVGKDYLRRVYAASQRMSQLIEALLSLSKQTGGELDRVPVNLSALARTAAEDLLKTDPERKTAVVIAEGIIREGDPVMLRVVLENLLGNAWKFTGKQERARIEFGALESAIRNSQSEMVYFVRDNGAGFNMDYAGKLFTAFQRLHSDADFPGIGIGLATVQRIINRHGGRIWAESEPDKGATFYFTL